ncbi:putative sucrose-phosphate synthase [Helianthus annuus]|nr:putative sucrose-phosphate synthase [Helianthus annuus]
MMRIQAPLSQFIAKMGGELMLLQCGRIVPKRSGVYLYLRWGMDLSKVVVFIGENGDIGYEGNLGSVHKSIILR